mmetsp:Transcript_45547/g.98645  ORF Transcript_45547/g.98645 Transcript_45547/m.98645 type:complete len:292 (-) Transcript_45547:314-1189(-)
MCELAPRRRILHAFCPLHPLKMSISLSPTRCSTTSSHEPSVAVSKTSSPSIVAMESTRDPPVALHKRRMSSFATRRTAMALFSTKYFMAASSKHNVGTGLEDPLNAFLGDRGLPLPDPFQGRRVVGDHLDAKAKLELAEVLVQKRDFGVHDARRHLLGGADAVQPVTRDEDRFAGAEAVGLENVDVLDRVADLPAVVGRFDVLGGVDDHVGEEVQVCVENLGGEGGARAVQENLLQLSRGKLVNLHTHVVLDELASLLLRHTVPSNDGRRVNLGLDQLVGVPQELSSHDDH